MSLSRAEGLQFLIEDELLCEAQSQQENFVPKPPVIREKVFLSEYIIHLI
jgi:hypothetical protein